MDGWEEKAVHLAKNCILCRGSSIMSSCNRQARRAFCRNAPLMFRLAQCANEHFNAELQHREDNRQETGQEQSRSTKYSYSQLHVLISVAFLHAQVAITLRYCSDSIPESGISEDPVWTLSRLGIWERRLRKALRDDFGTFKTKTMLTRSSVQRHCSRNGVKDENGEAHTPGLEFWCLLDAFLQVNDRPGQPTLDLRHWIECLHPPGAETPRTHRRNGAIER